MKVTGVRTKYLDEIACEPHTPVWRVLFENETKELAWGRAFAKLITCHVKYIAL